MTTSKKLKPRLFVEIEVKGKSYDIVCRSFDAHNENKRDKTIFFFFDSNGGDIGHIENAYILQCFVVSISKSISKDTPFRMLSEKTKTKLLEKIKCL